MKMVNIPSRKIYLCFWFRMRTKQNWRNAMLLYPYIENLTISHGKAAELLGISKWALIPLYDDMGLAYLDQDITEVMDEVAQYKQIDRGI